MLSAEQAMLAPWLAPRVRISLPTSSSTPGAPVTLFNQPQASMLSLREQLLQRDRARQLAVEQRVGRRRIPYQDSTALTGLSEARLAGLNGVAKNPGLGLIPFIPLLGDAAVDQMLKQHRQQMWINLASLAITTILAGISIWGVVRGK